MNKKIMQIFKNIQKTNDQVIKTEDHITPMCFILDDKKILCAIAMIFKNGDEKIAMRNVLKKFILKNKTKAYILIQDSIMTSIDQKTGKHETKDVVIRQIYTPKEKYMEMVFYKDKKITEKKVFSKEDMIKFSSEWNLWEDVEIKDYDDAAYQKIKRENPDAYKEVA